MKSYVTQDRFHLCGKAWQIRIMLHQWQQNFTGNIKIVDLIQERSIK